MFVTKSVTMLLSKWVIIVAQLKHFVFSVVTLYYTLRILDFVTLVSGGETGYGVAC